VTAALTFDGVTKRFGREMLALDRLTFKVPQGVICGLVGPNGAGKTTAFSIASGFLAADEGTVDVLGLGKYEVGAHKGLVGVLPQDAELPGRHTPAELLAHLGRLGGLSAVDAAREAHRWLEALNLEDRRESRIDTLSHGMRRRVAVASALVGQPRLVMLDEPTAGLDPVQARSLRALLAGLRGRTTVVISSHNLLELELLCDWVVLMERGRCTRFGSLGEVTGERERMEWTLASASVSREGLVAALPGLGVELEGDKLAVTVPPGGDPDEACLLVMRVLLDQRVAAREMRRGVGLERRMIDGAVGGRDTAARAG
jgi:ABC-2 type transport system ATP-binding protein